jgi:hypothetical protein
MKHIYTHDNIAILHNVKNMLATHDIESFVKNEHSVPLGARHGINNTFLELWLLHDADFERASALIKSEVESADQGEPWVCSKCNEENEGTFAVCWNCQNAAD